MQRGEGRSCGCCGAGSAVAVPVGGDAGGALYGTRRCGGTEAALEPRWPRGGGRGLSRQPGQFAVVLGDSGAAGGRCPRARSQGSGSAAAGGEGNVPGLVAGGCGGALGWPRLVARAGSIAARTRCFSVVSNHQIWPDFQGASEERFPHPRRVSLPSFRGCCKLPSSIEDSDVCVKQNDTQLQF